MATITANTGIGIDAFNYGTGDITVSNVGAITANAAGTTTTTTAQYGIAAFNYGIGSITVAGAVGSAINSGSTGILASNQATVIGTATPTTVTVTSLGTITSGTNLNNGGSAPAGIIANINPGGTGTYNGNVYGNVFVTAGSITAAAGSGIRAANDGIGNVAVNLAPNAIVSALNSSNAGSNNAPYGLNALDLGAGNVAVTTSNGDIINSGSDGINANNQATAITAAANALVTVNAAGSINSGNVQNNSGSAPAGIRAGFLGGTTTVANLNVNGDVIINNTAAISAAAGVGINAYNYGNGDVTINSTGNVSVTGSSIRANSTTSATTEAAEYGIEASAQSGGTGNIAINVYGGNINATSGSTTITNPIYGIFAINKGSGNISVLAANSASTITSSGVGIDAVNEASAIAAAAQSSIVVTSYAAISSGNVVTGTGNPPGGIIAGYLGSGSVPTAFPLPGLYGDVVVNNFGNINAAAGDGIRAYNFGYGDVTVNDNAGTITASQNWTSPVTGYGDGINASNGGPGNINVTTAAGVVIKSGASGIAAINRAPAPATTTETGSDWLGTSEVTVVAHGTITSGAIPPSSGDPAAGILAGFNPSSSDTINSSFKGDVLIDDYANITAAAGTDGIRGINYVNGSVTVVAEAGASISGGRYGIGAFAFGGVGSDSGDVTITNYATVTGSTAAIEAQATSAGTVFIDNYGMITGDVVSSGNATFHNEAGAIWNLAGSSTFTGTSALINDGAIDTTGVSSIGTSGVLSIANTGVVEVLSGSLDIAVAVTGLGSFTIDSGALLEFGASVASGSIVTFQGTAATLKLDDVAHFAGSVTGFALGDTIDLVGIGPGNVSITNPGSLQIGYGAGSIALVGNYNPADFTIGSDGQGGTDVTWSHQAPVISTSGLTVTQNGNGTTTITGLQVSDLDAAASTETFTMTATTGAAGSGTTVSPSTGSGLLTAINTELGTGVTYNPGATPPSTDKVVLSVTDGFGATDTVDFVFNLASSPTAPVTLTGTSGKDVIFATGNNDTLTGGGGADQFVFNKTTGAHTITDFSTVNDHIDLTGLSSIVTAATLNTWLASNVAASTTNPADTVISLGGSETITLHNVLAANVHASDFIVHA